MFSISLHRIQPVDSAFTQFYLRAVERVTSPPSIMQPRRAFKRPAAGRNPLRHTQTVHLAAEARVPIAIYSRTDLRGGHVT